MAEIGVLDSGVGGLSVLRAIHRLLPRHRTLYVADQGYAPYGPRTSDEIRARVQGIARFLLSQKVDVIVLACHAASAAALYPLRDAYPEMPFVGIEPAVKPAVERSRSGVIGVLTTQATADGLLYKRVVARYAAHARVITTPAPELVMDVERGQAESATAYRHVRERVAPMLAAGADEIVLACTHFPFLEKALKAVIGGAAELVDPGLAVSRQVGRVLPPEKPPCNANPEHRYYTTGDAALFAAHLRAMLGIEAVPQQITLQTGTPKHE